jgi:hypothetical protein
MIGMCVFPLGCRPLQNAGAEAMGYPMRAGNTLGTGLMLKLAGVSRDPVGAEERRAAKEGVQKLEQSIP